MGVRMLIEIANVFKSGSKYKRYFMAIINTLLPSISEQATTVGAQLMGISTSA
jgi:hypothetical protein